MHSTNLLIQAERAATHQGSSRTSSSFHLQMDPSQAKGYTYPFELMVRQLDEQLVQSLVTDPNLLLRGRPTLLNYTTLAMVGTKNRPARQLPPHLQDSDAHMEGATGANSKNSGPKGKGRGKGKYSGASSSYGRWSDNFSADDYKFTGRDLKHVEDYKDDQYTSTYKGKPSKGKGKRGKVYTPEVRQDWYGKWDDHQDPPTDGGDGYNSSSSWQQSQSWSSTPWRQGNTYGQRGNTGGPQKGQGKSWKSLQVGVFVIQLVMCSLCNTFSGLGDCQECSTKRLFPCPFGCKLNIIMFLAKLLGSSRLQPHYGIWNTRTILFC
jgi:hypothetical protein